MRLADRVAIVTGGAGALGLACARRLLTEGARVVLADLPDPSPALRGVLEASSALRYVPTDVTSAEQTQRLADTAHREFGRIDLLVNNAALFTTLARRPFEELETTDWESVLRVNVIGPFLCARAVAPIMRAAGRGVIVNVASNVVHKGLPQLLHYVASKGAVVAMTRALARELGPAGIRVNAVAPGYLLHEGTAASDGGRNEQVVRLRALGRTETPDDVVGTILFLASDDSAFLTGQTLVVDGGEVFA